MVFMANYYKGVILYITRRECEMICREYYGLTEFLFHKKNPHNMLMLYRL